MAYRWETFVKYFFKLLMQQMNHHHTHSVEIVLLVMESSMLELDTTMGILGPVVLGTFSQPLNYQPHAHTQTL